MGKTEDRRIRGQQRTRWLDGLYVGTSLVVLWLRLHLPVRGVQIQSLIGELKSHMTCDQKTQNIKLKQYCNKFNKDFKKKSLKTKRIL